MNAPDGQRRIVALTGDRFISLSDEAHLVYEARRRGEDIPTIAAALERQCGRRFALAHVESAIAILAANIERVSAVKRSGAHRKRMPLICAERVNAVAECLLPLFTAWPAVAIIAVSIGATTCSFTGAEIRHPTAVDLVIANLLFMLTIVAHEFGHATACRAAGERSGVIGLTTFFIFPAMYTDVSRAWLLNWKNRIAVDIGGVYFQLPLLGAISVAECITHAASFYLAELMILSGIAINLNPVLRLDGYWLIADALDMPSLSREPMRLIRAVKARMRPLPGRPRWQVAVVAVYGLLNSAAWCYAAACSVYVLWNGPLTILAGLRRATQSAFAPATCLQIGTTLTSLLLLTYGSVNLIRSGTRFARAFMAKAGIVQT